MANQSIAARLNNSSRRSQQGKGGSSASLDRLESSSIQAQGILKVMAKPGKKKSADDSPNDKVIAQNRKARHEYEVLAYLQVQLHRRNSQDSTAENGESDDPHHQVSLRSEMDLPWCLQLDCVGRYVDALPNRNIPGYAEVDVRLGWRPTKQFEISIVGQNLLDHRHREFRQLILGPPQAELERGVYGKVTFRF